MDFKPKIFKENGKWKLKYFYYPRSFNTFGMDSIARKRYQETCFISNYFDSLSDALSTLRHLYRDRIIYNQRFITK